LKENLWSLSDRKKKHTWQSCISLLKETLWYVAWSFSYRKTFGIKLSVMGLRNCYPIKKKNMHCVYFLKEIMCKSFCILFLHSFLLHPFDSLGNSVKWFAWSLSIGNMSSVTLLIYFASLLKEIGVFQW